MPIKDVRLIKVNLIQGEHQEAPARLEILAGESAHKLVIWEFFWDAFSGEDLNKVVTGCASSYPTRGIFHVSPDFVQQAISIHAHGFEDL